MLRDLITLPLRVAAFTTRVNVHIAVEALAAGVIVADRLIELAVPREEQLATRRSAWSVGVASAPAQTPPAEPSAEPAEPAADEQAAPVESSADADAQDGAWESFADAGAQDGAASSVPVDEPWEGYEGTNAHDVIHRLAAASAEEAAVVESYERSHGKRKTVLAAAERRQRQPAGAGSPS
jgi:hypothetical protein